MATAQFFRGFVAAMAVVVMVTAGSVLVGGPDRAAWAQGVEPPPQAVIDAAISGSRRGITRIRDYLAAGGEDPDEVDARAKLLIAALNAAGGVGKDLVGLAIERVHQVTAAFLGANRIISLSMDMNFDPNPEAIVFDFGDGPVMKGFDGVTSVHASVTGKNMRPKTAEQGEALMRDGLVGIERFQTTLPDGEYRVIVLTHNDGDTVTNRSPFGSSILLNDERNDLLHTEAEHWEKQAYLTTPDQFELDLGSDEVLPLEELEAVLDVDVSTSTAGAVVMYTTVVGGELVIQFDSRFSGAREAVERATFVTGLIIEPAHLPSMLIRTTPVLNLATALGTIDRPNTEKPETPTSGGS